MKITELFESSNAAYTAGLKHGSEGVGNNMDKAKREWGDQFADYNRGFLAGRNRKAKSMKAVGQGYGKKAVKEDLNEAYVEVPKLENIGSIGVKQDGNLYTVTASARKGPILAGIYQVCKMLSDKKGYTLKTLTGKVIDQAVLFKLFDTRPYGVKVESDAPNAAEVIQKAADSATAQVIADVKKMVQHKKDAPARKAEASKYAAAGRREELQKYDELYGKGTWSRVTYRQEGGDDGYQYVVRVDGKAIDSGLTLSSAKYEKLEAVRRLAKKEGLGTYGAKK